MSSRNKCNGCGRAIQGGSQQLSRHQNSCDEYRAKYNAVPGTSTGPNRGGTLLSRLQKLSSRARSKKHEKAKDITRSGEYAQSEEPRVDPSTNMSPMQIDDHAQIPGVPEQLDGQPTPGTNAHDRPVRTTRGKLPARYAKNALPDGPTPISEENEISDAQIEPNVPMRFLRLGRLGTVRLRLTETVRTVANKFGLSRLYYGRPSSVPDAYQPLEAVLDEISQESPSQRPPPATAGDSRMSEPTTIAEAIAPYPNFSAWLLNDHHWSQANKSKEDRRRLVKDVLGHPMFKQEDVADIDFDAIDRKLAGLSAAEFSPNDDSRFGRGWKESSVPIQIPHGVKKSADFRPTPEQCCFEATGVLHRSIPDVVCNAFSQVSASGFHYTPFREYWERPDTKITENVYSQFYSSTAFIEAHDEIQSLPAEPECNLPRAVAGIFIASDSAHLTDTGSATIHPFNVIIANNDKYENAKPTNHAIHPVMFLPPLSETIETFANQIPGAAKRSRENAVFTHCRREYFHGALRLLFDSDFWAMYRHGRVVKCADGITRRLYLRMFLYCADYPEKVIVATIRDGGGCPCPRCLVKHDDLHNIGTKDDMAARTSGIRLDNAERREKVSRARKVIYKDGYAVTSDHVESELKDESYVPVQNALSVDVPGLSFNLFSIFAVDLMHEIELGVWLGLLTHLVRILHTLGHEKIRILNERYHSISSFGRDAIRSFSTRVSDLSRMTADNYANMLQCSMPCFEALFPEPYDTEIQSLLFTLARWHSLAKLRMHTDSTLAQLERVTKDFGIAIRRFRSGCCERFVTYETPSEHDKRLRAAQSAVAAQKTTHAPVNTVRQVKNYNLKTVKMHFMPDYVPAIARFGTTDGYTTAINELSHKVPIAAFQRSSKHKFESQIVNQQSIREAHDEIRARLERLHLKSGTLAHAKAAGKRRSDNDKPIAGNPSQSYHIAQDEGKPVNLVDWMNDYSVDPAYEVYDLAITSTTDAFQDFFDRLQDYFLAQLLRRRGLPHLIPDSGRFPDIERTEVKILNNRLFRHAHVHFNYTTYDVRRAQDCASSARATRDIMMLSDEHAASHPFLYARILGIFHAHVMHPILSPRPCRLDVLWVRWFMQDATHYGGWVTRRLDRIGFVPQADPDAFGCLDPAQVLRACHLIPAFSLGRDKTLLGPSCARDSDDGDWSCYYVSRFSDRDLMMRYTGLGVGHVGDIPSNVDRTEPAALEEDLPETLEVSEGGV